MSAKAWKFAFVICFVWIAWNAWSAYSDYLDPEVACENAKENNSQQSFSSADGSGNVITIIRDPDKICDRAMQAVARKNDREWSDTLERIFIWTATALGVLAVIDQGIHVVRGRGG